MVRLLLVAGLIAIVLALAACVTVLFHYERKAARYDLSAVGRVPMESKVLDGAGDLVGWLHGEEVGIPVPLEQISTHFIEALVAREDSRFFRHRGLDHFGLVRAWLRNFREKRTVQGGSTITMQLTRMTYGLEGRTMRRKLLEMALARRIEKHYSKEEILTQYVNRIFLGTGMNGIEQAAQGYFGKPAADLTLPEAAMIAGIIRAPNGFSPFRHYEAALREMRGTIWRMANEGVISKDEAESYDDARPEVLPQERWMGMLRKQAKVSEQSYLLDMVDDRVDELLPSLAGAGGLTIRTTFDSRLQRIAEDAVADRLTRLEHTPGYPHPKIDGLSEGGEGPGGEPAYLQAAAVVAENFTGALRAIVGGRDYSESAFNRATRAKRDMGSIFKPLVYGAAFERGLFPGVLVSDAAIGPDEIEWEKTEWHPENADGVFGGMHPAEIGLIRSRNTMTVRVGEWAGIGNVLAMMKHAGLWQGRNIEPSAPVYLGTIGASVKDITSAYSVFATGGVRHEPFFIEAILDRDGVELFRHEDENYRVLSPGAAWLTSTILKRVLEEGGTGARVRDTGFAAPAAGKTGTTNDFFDAWFVGYTSRLSAGIWVGLDQPAKIMDGAYGGRIAMPIWEDIMNGAQAIGYEFTDFAAPEEVIDMELCRVSGLLPHEDCAAADSVYVEQVPHDLIPREFCREH
ncbi:MAG: transglycosylase domain-containing protein [Verrucomicrobiales bacterium]